MGGSLRKEKHGTCTSHPDNPQKRICETRDDNVYTCVQSSHKGHNCVKINKAKKNGTNSQGEVDSLKNELEDTSKYNTNGKERDKVKEGEEEIIETAGAYPEKVTVTGSGIQNGILSDFRGTFIVETRGAGAGNLSVSVKGPKGGFHVETYREHDYDRTINCRYQPNATGNYVINVKWAKVHVPGSPFHIEIFKSQEDMDKHSQNADS